MPIVPAEERIDKYSAFLAGDRLPPALTRYRDRMITKFGNYVRPAVAREVKTAKILDERHISDIIRCYYHCFVRECVPVRANKPAVSVLVEKWRRAGLEEGLLWELHAQVVMWDPEV